MYHERESGVFGNEMTKERSLGYRRDKKDNGKGNGTDQERSKRSILAMGLVV